MNPIDANMDTQTKIQTPISGGNDHVKANQGGNGDNQRHTRGKTRIIEATINSQFNTR